MARKPGRWRRLPMALLGCVMLTIGPASCSSPGSPASAGTPTSTATAAKPLKIGIAYGDTLVWKDDQDLAAGLDDAVYTGAGWIRVDLAWSDIQPDSATGYAWQGFDRVVAAARRRGLQVLPTLGYVPQWARRDSCASQDSCPPADPGLFARFAAAAAQRYAPQGVHTWQVWNEPNITIYWGPKADPAGYTRLLDAASKALRGADPAAVVLMGGLAAVHTDPAKGWLSQNDFLAAACKLGATTMVNAISYHPYTYPYLPSARTDFGTPWERISSTKDSLVSVLSACGTPNLPIWLTETGAPTNGPGEAADSPNAASNPTHVTEALQAAIAADAVPAAAADPHVAAVFWYTDRDTGQDADRANNELFFGLRRHDGSPKPSLDAFKAAVKETNPRR